MARRRLAPTDRKYSHLPPGDMSTLIRIVGTMSWWAPARTRTLEHDSAAISGPPDLEVLARQHAGQRADQVRGQRPSSASWLVRSSNKRASRSAHVPPGGDHDPLRSGSSASARCCWSPRSGAAGEPAVAAKSGVTAICQASPPPSNANSPFRHVCASCESASCWVELQRRREPSLGLTSSLDVENL
jgi:hypothetical protein